jgi:hypothetical protein
MYQGFMFYPEVTKSGKRLVKYFHPRLNPHLPRRFSWTGDTASLEKYITALNADDRVALKFFDQEGLASDHTYIDTEENGPTINLSPEMMCAILLGEFPVSVPATAIIRVRNATTRFCATEFLAMMAEKGVIANWEEHVARCAAKYQHLWKQYPLPGLPDTSNQNASISNGRYANPANNFIAAGMDPDDWFKDDQDDSPMPLAADEKIVSVDHHATGCTMITKVVNGKTYYLRREFDLDDSLRSLSSSWDPAGPWAIVDTEAA